MKKIVALMLVVMMFVCCAGAMAEEEAIKIAVIYSGTVDDKGWCQAMDSGIQNAIASGLNIDYTPVESVAVPDAESTLNRLVGDYDIIIVHGAQFSNAVETVSEENPDQIFAMGTSDKVMADNVFTYMPASEEPGYINGYISGLLSEGGKVGVVGSSDNGDSARYVRGFIMGYRAACPDAAEDPMVTWTGSFDDTVGAGDIADIMIGAGCTVLTGSSQQAIGALRKVAAAENVLWTAQTLAQMTDFPEVTVCAADYEYAAVIENLVASFKEGVTGGVCITMFYNNGGFVFQFSDKVSDDVKAAAQTVIDEITANPGSVDYTSIVLE